MSVKEKRRVNREATSRITGEPLNAGAGRVVRGERPPTPMGPAVLRSPEERLAVDAPPPPEPEGEPLSPVGWAVGAAVVGAVGAALFVPRVPWLIAGALSGGVGYVFAKMGE